MCFKGLAGGGDSCENAINCFQGAKTYFQKWKDTIDFVGLRPGGS